MTSFMVRHKFTEFLCLMLLPICVFRWTVLIGCPAQWTMAVPTDYGIKLAPQWAMASTVKMESPLRNFPSDVHQHTFD